MNITWNAQDYTRDFSFVHQYGEDVLGLLTAQPGSFVVDVGCGNGALTERLAQAGYRALGIDASPDMLAKARALHPGLAFRQADALSFTLPEKADALFSNAVFHWIDADKQPLLLANLSRALRPGGELVCEFGGCGCAERVHTALEHAFAARSLAYPRVFYFPTIGEYAPLLEQAGLTVTHAFLFDRPTPQNGPDGLKSWIRMFVTAPFAGMAPDMADAIIDDAVSEAQAQLLRPDGTWIVDYVRIRLRAVKR